jgi:hypothetical protein
MPKKYMILTIAVMAILSSPCRADNRVWAEQNVGRASTNWDLSHQQTRITEVYLQIVGPSDLLGAIGDAIAACAGNSLRLAYQTFQATPAEPAGKTAAAAATFKSSFLACATIAHVALAVANKFTLNLGRKEHWESGIFGTGTIENPNAAAVDKYIIQNAPPGTRNALSQANRILNPSYSVPNVSIPVVSVPGVGNVPVPVPVPQRSPVPLSIGGHKFL